MFEIMTLCETPSVLMNLLRSRCVVVLVKFLKVLVTCRKYGTRQAQQPIGPGSGYTFHSLSRDRFYFMLRNTTTSRDKVRPQSPVVGESGTIHKPERKVNGCLGMTRRCSRRVCQVTLARLNFDSESSASHDEMRLLDLFATQSNKSNNILINLDVCLEVLP